MVKIHFHGHACFSISDGESSVLIDPFLKPHNPVADVDALAVKPNDILITHGHQDHVADVIEIANRTGASVSAIYEISQWLEKQGVIRTNGLNLGGTINFAWGWAKLVQAFHSNVLPDGSVFGSPAGWVINIGGKTIYHLGDTALFSDLKLIAERTPVDIAIIPIGGYFTMDRYDAVVATQLIGAKIVIPCHYDTFPQIKTNAEAFKQEVESNSLIKVEALTPGEVGEY